MAFLLDDPPDGLGQDGGTRVVPLGKIVRRDEHIALLDARGVVAKARRDAARIVEDARHAYRQERERGYAEGLQAAQAEQAAAMVAIHRQTAGFLKQVEHDVADLVMASLRRILADFDDSERVLAVVASGLALLRRQKSVLLRVHTDDAAVVRRHMQALSSRFPGIDYIDVVADDRYARGACRMETAIGTIETSLDRQLDVLQRALCPLDAMSEETTTETGRNASDV